MKIQSSLLFSLLLAASPALAQNNTVWTGANGTNWNVGTNWNTTTVPTDGQVFITNGNTALVNDNRSVNSIGNAYVGQNANNGGVAVTTGGSLKLGNLLLGRDGNLVGTATVSGGNLTVTNLTVGDGRGNVSGGRGTFTLSSGTVSVATDFTLGASANNVTSGTVNISGGSLISPNLIVGSAGNGTFGQNGGNVTITGTTFQIASNSTRNSVLNLSGTAVMNAANATVQVGGAGSGTGGLGLFAGGTLNAAGVLVAANSSFTDLGGTLNVSGNITNNGIWIFSNSAALTSNYSIGGSGGLTKNAAGILTLAAANTYTGNTTLNVSNIRLGVNDAISTSSLFQFGALSGDRRLQMQGFNQTLRGVDSTGASGILVIESAADNTSNAPATLTLNVAAAQSYTFGGWVRNAVGNATNSALSITKSGDGTQVFSAIAGEVTYSGNTTINGGVLEFSGTNSVANNSAMTVNAGGTVRFSGGGNRTTAIAGAGNLEKAGANVLTLSGTNTYTGNTTVNAGTLLINGSTAAASIVTVASGAVLGGNGTVGGSVTVNAGGTLSPGNSPGVLTVSGNLTLAGNTLMEVATGTRGTNFDGINIGDGKLLTYGGNLTLNIGATIDEGTYDLFSSVTLLTPLNKAGNFAGINLTGTIYTVTWGQSGDIWTSSFDNGRGFTFSQLTGDLTVVPEPSTWALLAGSLTALLVFRRRRAS